jgi:hypothetical protein
MKIKESIAISESGFMFDPSTGDSFSLNQTGKEILAFLKSGKSEEEIKEIMIEKYEIDNFTLEHNFYDFMEMLKTFNVLTAE